MRVCVALTGLLLVVSCGAPPPPAAPPKAPVEAPSEPDAGAKPSAATVVTFETLMVRVTIPPGWRVQGDDALQALLETDPKQFAEQALERSGKGPVLVLVRPGDERSSLLFVLQVLPTDNQAEPVKMLAAKAKRMRGERGKVLSGPAKLEPSGAEMTNRHDVVTRNEQRLVVRQTERLVIKGGQGVLTSVTWPDEMGERPAEATAMIDAVEFF